MVAKKHTVLVVLANIPVLIDSLAIWTASCESPAIFSAVLMASFTNSSAGKTRLTKPEKRLHQGFISILLILLQKNNNNKKRKIKKTQGLSETKL